MHPSNRPNVVRRRDCSASSFVDAFTFSCEISNSRYMLPTFEALERKPSKGSLKFILFIFFVGWVLFFFCTRGYCLFPSLCPKIISTKNNNKKRGNQLTKGTRLLRGRRTFMAKGPYSTTAAQKKTTSKEGRTILRRRDTRAVHEIRGTSRGRLAGGGGAFLKNRCRCTRASYWGILLVSLRRCRRT